LNNLSIDNNLNKIIKTLEQAVLWNILLRVVVVLSVQML
jgi:hypothetical protein